jgi:competence protein ComEC
MSLQQKESMFDLLRGYTLVAVVVAWLAGILLNSMLSLPYLILCVGVCLFGLLIIVFYQDRQMRFPMLLALCFCLGALRYSVALPSNDPHSITTFIGPSSLEVRGTVADEPKVQVHTRLLLVDASAVSTDGGNSWKEAHGQLQVETLDTALEDPYGANYGDSVELQGKLQEPILFHPACEEGTVDPATNGTAGIFASMLFPRVSVTDTDGNSVIARLYHLRVILATVIEQALPQPAAAVLVAIVLGLQTPDLQSLSSVPNLLGTGYLSLNLKCAFSFTGTIHLTVSSGFKVTILAGLVASSTRIFYKRRETHLLPAEKLSDWRPWLTTGFVVVSIAAYTVLSGAGPAAIRSGIMGILMVIAPLLGRVYNVYAALALAALGMSCADPFVLWDVGFQLSFIGTLGIVMLTPYCQYPLRPLMRLPFGHFVGEIIAVTLAAQIATWPIVAVTFQQVSFIAPLANLLTVPLLGVLIMLGMLICATGVFFAPLAWLCGWIAWPILWYTYTIVLLCAQPWAYTPLSNVDQSLAWSYYSLLALLLIMLYRRWPALSTDSSTHAGGETASPLARGFSRRTWRLVQLGAAILIMVGTGIDRLITQPNGLLTVTFLSVGPANQPPQGEAIVVRTPDGKTMLIDGGMDAASLSQALDSRLPSWQRSLDIVLLTSPRQDHLTGLQDIVTRYAIGEVIDAGMLHPNTTYTRWRRTISECNLHYTQVVQGDTISLGTATKLQVLWPTSPLHSGSNEVRDNGLIIQLRAPGLRMLLLGASAQSNYALAGLADSLDASVLQSDIVQIVGEAGKPIPQAVVDVLQRVHPSLLVVTSGELSAAQRKAHSSPDILSPGTIPVIRTIQTAQVGTLEITSDDRGWSTN